MAEHSNPLDTFKEEAADLLTGLESALIELEENPEQQEHIDEAFRDLHTLKGSASMFDLKDLVSFAHTIESAFARVRDGKEGMSEDLVSLGLRAKDHIEQLLSAGPEGSDDLRDESARLAARALELMPALASELQRASGQSGSLDPTAAAAPGTQDGGSAGGFTGVSTEGLAEASREKTYRIEFIPARDLLQTGSNPLYLLKELSELGTILTMGYAEQVPPLSELDPELCYLHWDILLTSTHDTNAIRDVFIFVEGDSTINITLVDEGETFEADTSYKRLGEILLERGDVSREELESAVNERSFLGDVLVSRGYVSTERVEAALKEQTYVRKLRETRQSSEGQASIKVRTDKLDALVDLVGEFVSAHANLSLIAGERGDDELGGSVERVEGLVRQLRDLSMDMHMVPVELLFGGFRRLVRDLSRDLGKQVNLQMEGTDTELDKNIIESLRDPLLHIIRNSIDHGIEAPEQRREAGKPETGTLVLRAYQSGAQVVIEVQDDGQGINLERVRARAVERGLISAQEELSEQDVQMLIFAPGFSTAEQATNVSGRGVGMDVVKRNIESLRGGVTIRSERGSGTTMRLRIPLTLAIVEGLLADVGAGQYMINISYIVECVDFDTVHKSGNMIHYRGDVLPWVDLRQFFGVEPRGAHPQLVVVQAEDQRIGLLVDTIHHNYQSVIKSLGKLYAGVDGVSGAVILGDGSIALMLDAERLVRVADRVESSR